MASRLEVMASRLEVMASRLEVMASRLVFLTPWSADVLRSTRPWTSSSALSRPPGRGVLGSEDGCSHAGVAACEGLRHQLQSIQMNQLCPGREDTMKVGRRWDDGERPSFVCSSGWSSLSSKSLKIVGWVFVCISTQFITILVFFCLNGL